MAGLLGSIFDPQLYANGSGGLLARLQPMVNAVPQSTGFPQTEQPNPIAVGDYQMPRVGNADLFQPQQVNTPPNAQPAQGQLQPQGFFDRLNAGFQSIGNGGSLIGAATGNYTDVPNQTQKFLISRGFDPGLARAVTSDPRLLQAVLPQVLGTGGQTDDIKEYQFAKREEPNLTFQQFMNRKRATTGEYSLTPQYGTDKDGNTVLIQTGKSGEAIQTKLPAGVKISSGVDKVDLGTQWGIIDKRTGNLVGTQPKNIEGKEAAEEIGKARGQAQVNLPNVIANAEQTLQIIKSIKDDPYRERGTGGSSIFNRIPATGGFDFAQKVEQLKGKAFLEAFQSLKGGGAITEIEGKKAENAIARLNVAQSEPAFLDALNELEQVVTAGIGRAKQRAGAPAAPAAAAPTTGLPAGWSVRQR